jgi:hypothetical protein
VNAAVTERLPAARADVVQLAAPDATVTSWQSTWEPDRKVTPVTSTVLARPPLAVRFERVVVWESTSTTKPSSPELVTVVSPDEAPSMVTDLLTAFGRIGPSKTPTPTWIVPRSATA